MSINFQEILKELEYRVEHGIIDLTKEEQVTKLSEILRENRVENPNEIAQKVRVYFSYLNELEEADKKKKGDIDKVLNQTFKNPETGKMVKVASALGYDKKSPAYKTAKGMFASAGFSDKDIDMVDTAKGDEEQPVKKTSKQSPPAPKGKKLGGADFKTDLEKDKEQPAVSVKKQTTQKPVSNNQNSELVDKNVRNSIKEFENFLSDKQKLAIKLSEKQRVLELKKLDTLSESFKKLPNEIKNTASAVFAKGQIYEGRENSGIGKNRLGFIDVKTLDSNRDYLLKAYGDGSPETIRKFVRGARSIKVTEEYVESSFNLLPDALQTALMGKGKTGDSGKDKHFLGYLRKDGTTTSDYTDPNINKDKNGNLQMKRGNPGNRDRGKFVWRCILEQGGKDAYTGLPLDLSSIDLEHVRAFDNKDTGQPSVTDYLNRENDNNIVIIATNINQKKSNLSMKKFFEMHVNPQVGKSEAAFKKESDTYETINEVASQTDQKAHLAVKDGKLKPGYNFKNLKALFDNDDNVYFKAKSEFKKVAETREDMKAIEGLNSEMGKSILMAIGLGRGIIDKSGRRTIKLSSDNLYRGFLLSMAEQPDKQDKFKAAWENARKIANSDKYRLKGKGQQGMLKYLIDNKFISKSVLNDPKLGRVFQNALNEVYDYNNDVYVLHS
jgi:hypothetical protein